MTGGSYTPKLNYPKFFIGRLSQSNVQNFIGKIDDVRLYNRALTGTEIQALYNEGK